MAMATAIANLGGDDGLVQKKKLGSFFLKPFRVDRCLEAKGEQECVNIIDAIYRNWDIGKPV